MLCLRYAELFNFSCGLLMKGAHSLNTILSEARGDGHASGAEEVNCVRFPDVMFLVKFRDDLDVGITTEDELAIVWRWYL
jgi:hypothetical protein